ncbi:DoxX family protein [Candidimonas humi]|uniref:DoxX family protein n=1 Tax=Candidimonas humi TaxID=683355 RepID=A0ABV8NZR8_9BURK|nr:DoxX family protein [Candidimonas humi]MBV6305729.1 DoxX family protein [Candidimonas humi]
MTSDANCQVWAARAQALLRIVAGYIFLLHGCSKLFHVPHVAYFDNLQLFSLMGLAGVIEVVAGILLILGLFTRIAAFIASGEMAFAYFMGHVGTGGHALLPILNGGEAAVLYCFIFLFLAAAGGGACSLDAARRKA